tara:strand:+ start:378 stop:629 length:252 start_codon:yes stop_codon:yes gene_type:complete
MKKWYTSKTVWVGIFQILASITLIMSELMVDSEYISAILAVNGFLGIALRWITDKPITSPIKSLDNLRPEIQLNEAARRYIVK